MEQKLQGEKNMDDNNAAAAPGDDADEHQQPPKKKRRKGGAVVDLTKLSPEERMRREEQKRLQQEAAKAREVDRAGIISMSTTATSGVSTGKSKQHKHPLNSERRRANRRKPKWEPKSSSSAHAAPPNEHDSSGYHMRKITGGKPNQK